ncbi:MAG: SEC-C domain-containing protein, partial [Selenomonadaceae bacterium]|nr:SEC-C domain-containing protein [Selenomonadaceae bacterium]
MKRNDPCWCGSGKKYKKCHADFDARLDEIKFIKAKNQVRPPKRLINNAADIEGIKRAAVINSGALDLMSELVKEGVDTLTLNNAAHEFIV